MTHLVSPIEVRIAQMAARLRAAGAELAHDAGQALGPVAGAKCPALARKAQDVDFFGEGGSHVLGMGRYGRVTGGRLAFLRVAGVLHRAKQFTRCIRASSYTI